MSALDDIHDRRRLLDSDDRALAALAAAYPDGPPEDVAIEPMTDGDFYRTYQRPQEYQPAPTYQAQTTTVTPVPTASPGLTSNQAIGLGALALAGYVYTKQSAPKRRKR